MPQKNIVCCMSIRISMLYGETEGSDFMYFNKIQEYILSLHGTIEATVDYQKWESHIIMVLPLLEFYRDSDKGLFLDILKNSHGFNVTATEDGKVRLYILINYFQEIMPKDWDEIAYDVILGLSEEDYE